MEITVKKLIEILNSDLSYKLIDVREPYEYEDCNIKNSINIPMDEVLGMINDIENVDYIIFCCRTGRRSAAVNYMVRRQFKKTNTYNLRSGYENYKEYIK